MSRYHSISSRLGVDLPPRNIEYDEKYFTFYRCIYRKDPANQFKRRRVPFALLYKCINLRCVGLLKYPIEKQEMYKLREHSEFCDKKMSTKYLHIRADLCAEMALPDSVYINDVFLKVVEQEMNQPFSFEPSVSIH